MAEIPDSEPEHRVDPVRLLRSSLVALAQTVGPGFTHAALLKHAARFGGRLSRSTMADLRRRESATLPLWSTVRTFVLAALGYADEWAIAVPPRLRDMGRWQRLYDECRAFRAGTSNVVAGDVGSAAVVQARDIHGNVQLTVGPASSSAVRSAYLEQVVRIAPECLYDRDVELAELADWCLRSDQQPGYLWWRAPAWAGKSALLPWFVLHPPAGIRVVSFFVTARLSGQSDKRAFAEVVLEQLAQLCGQPLPDLLTDATRDAHLLALLAEAASVCQRRGERLVLVVDGLDEDRGVTIGPDAHSIAALLPARPPGGVRIVVGGRPDPPIPTDVPPGHGVRDPRIVRELRHSEYAEVVRHDAQRELGQLLHGTTAEQDLLGLITAAGGGLSGPDLAELTGSAEWEIEELLCAVTGRTFSSRTVGRGLPNTPPVYVLAHEQLQQDATRMLGPNRLAAYRQRLHEWASGYRERSWPVSTPEYLLRGYHRLLRETHEIGLLVDSGLDRARHARMLDLTGGDTAALAEVTAAQDTLHAQVEPDLVAITRLAAYRDDILDRNLLIPTKLPEAWSKLGHYARAETLAKMLPEPAHARALAAVARAATSALVTAQPRNDTDNSARRAISGRQAPGPRRNTRDINARRNNKLKDVETAISTGDFDKAEALADSIHQPQQRHRAKLAVVRAVASSDGTRAEKIARRTRNPRWLAQALVELVVPIVDAGDQAHAEELAAEAEKLSRIAVPTQRLDVVTTVATALATVGDVAGAEQLARVLDNPHEQARALAEVVTAVVATGQVERAAALAEDIIDPVWRATALMRVVRAASPAGEVAGRITARASAAIRAVGSSYHRDRLLGRLAGALAADDLAGAETVMAAIQHEHIRQEALAGLVTVLADADQVKLADDLAESIDDREQREWALPAVASAWARAGDVPRAMAICRSLAQPRWRVRALLAVGNGTDTHKLLIEAESTLALIDYTAQHAQAQAEVVAAWAAAGEIERAEALAGMIPVAQWRARALGAVVDTLAAAGALDRAHEVADRISDVELRTSAVTRLALVGDSAEGHRVVARALRSGRWQPALPVLSVLEPDAVRAVGTDLLAAANPTAAG